MLPAVAALLATQLFPSLAHADAAAAEALFQDGRKLLAAGKVAEACEKFAASNKLDPSSGTLLNLANCRVKEGKLATAWATFLSASTLAMSQGNAGRASEATRRAAELEQRLSYVSIVLASRPPGLVVKRDGVEIEAATLDTRIPVDPGAHAFSASAPGFVDWSSTVEVSKPGVEEVRIPALKKADVPAGPAPTASARPVASAAPTSSAAPPASASAALPPGRSPTAGYVVGGVGLAVTAVGAYFGLRALGAYRDAEALCGSHKACPESARSPSDDATRSSTFATLGVGLGLATVGVGAYLVLTADREKQGESGLQLSPHVGLGYQGATLRGSF
jgi:hypothetical protein